MKIKIIFEDNHIIAVEKPVNIPVQKDKSNDQDMLTLLKQDIKERFKKPGKVYLGLIHRMDRPAGGVMIFAKTSKAASRLSQQMRSGQFKKIYLSVLHGRLKKSTGILKHYLLKDKKNNTVKSVSEYTSGAKMASLSYKEIEYTDGLSLVKINLNTGKSHQIRVQFSSLGYPLWGDQKYGSNLNRAGQQLALWAYEISFAHPRSGEYMTLTSWPPVKEPWNLFRSYLKNP